MINPGVVTLVLMVVFVAGCQKDVTFQVDTVTEVSLEPSSTHKWWLMRMRLKVMSQLAI
ncbi:hypothetical protein Sps_02194 [Shewanella psychrophila]|uniref:Uncharacterized protein n=1 Tax=Shewanella psychrophila TaxID=225848 RepID=A0A1S6HPC2_9GAMM|nr:hypothetical protein Sps_02194 [Shewanella psychrophila]